MLRRLTELFNSTVHNEDPEHMGRVYLELEDGTTAHGAVGGSSKKNIEAKTLEKLRSGERLIKVEELEEGDINHPLR